MTTALEQIEAIAKAKGKSNLPPGMRLVSRKEAAEILGVQPCTLAMWEHTGRYSLPVVKIGSLCKYRLSDLQQFIEDNLA